jgi:hypothetical protein
VYSGIGLYIAPRLVPRSLDDLGLRGGHGGGGVSARAHLRPGTLIYVDEFVDRDHEMRAFNELRARSLLQFKPVAIAHGGPHWLFET